MGAYKIVFAPHADRDLDRILRYISRDNPDAAVRLGLTLIDRAIGLSEQATAQMGSCVRKRPNVRRLVEGNYLIYYRIFPDQKKVRILRFWHASQSPRRLRTNV
jgi:plasmid stabilization system protein ParE